MLKSTILRRLPTLLALLLLVCAGCTADDPVIPEPTGTIQVDPSSDAFATPWTLTGPHTFSAHGTGAETLNNLALGAYTIVWTDVTGWMAPASETRILTADKILTLSGVFTDRGAGSVSIECAPDALDAPWHLLGPKGLSLAGQGDTKLAGMVAGDYWVSWGPIAGWESPAGYAQPLVAGDAITFSGVYLELPPEPALPFAGSEDQLMMNFRTVYEEMNFASFAELMHPDFLMLLQQRTIQEFPDLGPTLDRAEEMRIAERMFGGEPVTDPDGYLVPGIAQIDIPLFARQGDWADAPANDPIPGTRFALYDVVFHFNRPGFSTLKVEGTLKFSVAGRDSFHNGAVRTFYEMKGQQDLTLGVGKAVENAPFGSVKALFR